MLEHYCQPGSVLYYSLKKTPILQRKAILAVMAFYQEIENIVFEVNDPNLAILKLNWWRDEISKIQNGTPEHPVSRELKNISNLSCEHLHTIIDGMQQNLFFLPFLSFEEVTIHIMRTAGARECLLAEIVTVNPPNQEVIYQFALMLELIHYMQNLHRYIKKGLIIFSEEEMKKFFVKGEDLQKFKTTHEIKRLLSYQAEKAERAYKNAREGMTTKTLKDLSSLIVRCEISLATLKEIRSSDFNVLENFISLTPIRYWWIAMKH